MGSINDMTQHPPRLSPSEIDSITYRLAVKDDFDRLIHLADAAVRPMDDSLRDGRLWWCPERYPPYHPFSVTAWAGNEFFSCIVAEVTLKSGSKLIVGFALWVFTAYEEDQNNSSEVILTSGICPRLRSIWGWYLSGDLKPHPSGTDARPVTASIRGDASEFFIVGGYENHWVLVNSAFDPAYRDLHLEDDMVEWACDIADKENLGLAAVKWPPKACGMLRRNGFRMLETSFSQREFPYLGLRARETYLVCRIPGTTDELCPEDVGIYLRQLNQNSDDGHPINMNYLIGSRSNPNHVNGNRVNVEHVNGNHTNGGIPQDIPEQRLPSAVSDSGSSSNNPVSVATQTGSQRASDVSILSDRWVPWDEIQWDFVVREYQNTSFPFSPGYWESITDPAGRDPSPDATINRRSSSGGRNGRRSHRVRSVNPPIRRSGSRSDAPVRSRRATRNESTGGGGQAGRERNAVSAGPSSDRSRRGSDVPLLPPPNEQYPVRSDDDMASRYEGFDIRLA